MRIAMRGLDDTRLIELMLECIEWRLAIAESHTKLHNRSAQMVWNALVRIEIDMVAAAYKRASEERHSRGFDEDEFGYLK
jgi:hypothetical protein